MTPTILEMPDVAMDNILKKCDFQAIHSLRKVCRGFRNYIDDKIPEANLTGVFIEPRFGQIVVNYYETTFPIEILYQEVGNRCLIKNEKKVKLLENLKYSEAFLNDFKLVLRHQKRPLQSFSFRNFKGYENNFLELPQLIQVENFEIFAKNHSEILSILPYLDPRNLKSIGICDTHEITVQEEPLEMREIVKLEQWKEGEEVCCSKKMKNVGLESFGHFLSGFVKILTIDSDGLVDLKENFRASPGFKHFCIEYTNFEDEQQFLETIGPEYDIFGQKKWFFDVENTTKCLSLLHDPPNKQFSFALIDVSSIPPDADVQI